MKRICKLLLLTSIFTFDAKAIPTELLYSGGTLSKSIKHKNFIGFHEAEIMFDDFGKKLRKFGNFNIENGSKRDQDIPLDPIATVLKILYPFRDGVSFNPNQSNSEITGVMNGEEASKLACLVLDGNFEKIQTFVLGVKEKNKKKLKGNGGTRELLKSIEEALSYKTAFYPQYFLPNLFIKFAEDKSDKKNELLFLADCLYGEEAARKWVEHELKEPASLEHFLNQEHFNAEEYVELTNCIKKEERFPEPTQYTLVNFEIQEEGNKYKISFPNCVENVVFNLYNAFFYKGGEYNFELMEEKIPKDAPIWKYFNSSTEEIDLRKIYSAYTEHAKNIISQILSNINNKTKSSSLLYKESKGDFEHDMRAYLPTFVDAFEYLLFGKIKPYELEGEYFTKDEIKELLSKNDQPSLQKISEQAERKFSQMIEFITVGSIKIKTVSFIGQEILDGRNLGVYFFDGKDELFERALFYIKLEGDCISNSHAELVKDKSDNPISLKINKKKELSLKEFYGEELGTNKFNRKEYQGNTCSAILNCFSTKDLCEYNFLDKELKKKDIEALCLYFYNKFKSDHPVEDYHQIIRAYKKICGWESLINDRNASLIYRKTLEKIETIPLINYRKLVASKEKSIEDLIKGIKEIDFNKIPFDPVFLFQLVYSFEIADAVIEGIKCADNKELFDRKIEIITKVAYQILAHRIAHCPADSFKESFDKFELFCSKYSVEVSPIISNVDFLKSISIKNPIKPALDFMEKVLINENEKHKEILNNIKVLFEEKIRKGLDNLDGKKKILSITKNTEDLGKIETEWVTIYNNQAIIKNFLKKYEIIQE